MRRTEDPAARAECNRRDDHAEQRGISRRPRIDFPDASVQLPPAEERVVLYLLKKQGYGQNYRFKRILAGRPLKDAYTPEKRRAYWAAWSAERRDERNARARDNYRRRRHLQGAISFLQKVLTTDLPACEHGRMKRQSAGQKPVDAREVARFISTRIGEEISAQAVLTWARRGRIPCQQLVGKYYFTLAEIGAWLEAGRVAIDAARALDEVRRIPRLMA